MASTDYPLSVSSKFIDDAGTEHLVTVRGRNLDDFSNRLNEAGNIFPYAGFARHDATPTAEQSIPSSTPPPTPINPAATAAQATQNAQARSAASSSQRKANAPKCATHGTPMLASKRDNGGYYCPAKNADNTYCVTKAA